MFTGIIEGIGTVRSLDEGVLQLESVRIGADPWRVGESIAVNGACLTLINYSDELRFDISPETLQRTALEGLVPGSRVNLERAMKADGRFGGHIVQGHVDATAEVGAILSTDNSTVFRFQVLSDLDRYLIDKGSVTIDGISLTVVHPNDGEFDVWVIPHTLQETNLGDRKIGDLVNVEFDVIAKYVEKLTSR
ncbi:MAG: riboflavin synthase [Fimbriimonadaceae bacterium]|jgi:riboflavin synthase|nr:riboflavin synthase [Fimbriimonadaceae bacterium]